MFTINNTLPEFYWLTNFVETIMSTEVWKPMTSATIALQYRKIVEKWADKTCDNTDHIPYQVWRQQRREDNRLPWKREPMSATDVR